MSGDARRLAALVVGAAWLAGLPASAQPVLGFEAAEIRRILQHGPWPTPTPRDPSNRVSGDPRAVALGRRLFFEPRLSATAAVACASCHVPERAWADGRARGVGLAPLDRNTPSLLDAALHRWFAWDGRSDSLWSQGMKALLDPREMGASAEHVAAVVAADPTLSCLYERVYGPRRDGDAEPVLVNVGKGLAAFLEGVRSGRTPFDEFRDALARGNRGAAARYPVAARRGLKTFVGQGRCHVCHFGPQFTNGEFADTGIGFFISRGKVDSGRHEGIKRLKGNPHNLLGRFNDDASKSTATGTRHVELQHRNFGEWRVPGLRNVAQTAPYMHNGSLATLRDVVKHYSELNEERLHADGERVLKPLRLTPAEVDDLVAFLESLSPAPDRR